MLLSLMHVAIQCVSDKGIPTGLLNFLCHADVLRVLHNAVAYYTEAGRLGMAAKQLRVSCAKPNVLAPNASPTPFFHGFCNRSNT